MNTQFDEIFQSSLDLIRGGQETIDSIVARYPEYAEELRAQLEVATWLSSSSTVLDPRPGFISASRNRLVARIKQEQQPGVAAPLTWGERLQQFFSVQKVAPTAFVIVLLLALFVSGSVVSASQKSLPGDDLYSVKLTLEQIALVTSLDEKNDAELHIQFVEKRITEVQALFVEERYEDVAETIEEFSEEVSKTIQILETIYDEDRFLAIELANELETLLNEQQHILTVLLENAPISTTLSITRVFATTEIVERTAEEFSDIFPSPISPLSVPPTDEPTVPPTNAPRPTPTFAPTERPVRPTPIPTNTQKPPTPVPPTSTPLPTNTPVPPTNTPVPTDTPTNTPTNTPLPTDTPTPLPTDTPTPTNTPLPTDTPTNTSTPEPTATEMTSSESTPGPTQQQGSEATPTP
jgi:hypothetical protein